MRRGEAIRTDASDKDFTPYHRNPSGTKFSLGESDYESDHWASGADHNHVCGRLRGATCLPGRGCFGRCLRRISTHLLRARILWAAAMVPSVRARPLLLSWV